ncbi:MAG: hypothetical protein NTX06_05170 [Proteobacteria bacterium]|nr:hypothetical protein [Pseudomonadota bacterium]
MILKSGALIDARIHGAPHVLKYIFLRKIEKKNRDQTHFGKLRIKVGTYKALLLTLLQKAGYALRNFYEVLFREQVNSTSQ